LHPNNINVNNKIWDSYINNVVPRICPIDDDSNYGSSATIDTSCLQALSRRIHFGILKIYFILKNNNNYYYIFISIIKI